MREGYRIRSRNVFAAVFCLSVILLTGCGPRRVKFLDGSGNKGRPRARVGRYASPTLGNIFIEPENLGSHGYSSGWAERTGIVYTCRAGHIDIAHVRKTADLTAYLTSKTLQEIEAGSTEFSFKLKEPSRHYVQITYPQNWDGMPDAEKDRIGREVAIRFGQYCAYAAATWHEILTWFGYRSIGLYPEFPSAFSWEDTFSDLLGTHIGATALRDTEHKYDEAMTAALERELEKLGALPRAAAIRASKKVRGLWFSGDFLFLVDMKGRNLDIGLDDGFVTPWLVPSVPECEGATPELYSAPNLDFLSEYGFSMKFEIHPRVFEKGKILRIAYPDGKTKKKRIEPAIHFAAIMERIKQDAVEKHGYEVSATQAFAKGPPQEQTPNPDRAAPPDLGDSVALSNSLDYADLNSDNVVDIRDVVLFVERWLSQAVPPTEGAR